LASTEAAEPYDSFLENALAKARHVCFATRLPALADDSGLCVDAWRGAGDSLGTLRGEAEIGHAQQRKTAY